jgi:response regulator RpfG family c-di-GMP phosphodiesterase
VNVVVIDDTPVMLLRLERLVQTLSECRVIPFSNALDALAWCAVNEPDLLIVDYLLPDMSGLDFVQRLQQSPRNNEVPVVIVTQDHDRAVRRLALQIGVNDFLTKPFDQAELQARVRNMLVLRGRHKALAANAAALAEDIERAAGGVRLRESEALECLACAAEHRDPETHEHILRLSHYSALIARELGLPSSECELLLQAARLHDVGKLAIPETILLKPGRLEPGEVRIMRTHTTHGHQILADSASAILRAGAEIALCHHERFDGSGYPAGLQTNAIPLYARIVAVADVFDALTTRRPYKEAWDVERAARAIREAAGTEFDPACVTAFLQAWQQILEVKARYAETGPVLQ